MITDATEVRLMEVVRIMNDPGMTWKVRRALLREMKISEDVIVELIPEPPEGMALHPGDY